MSHLHRTALKPRPRQAGFSFQLTRTQRGLLLPDHRSIFSGLADLNGSREGAVEKYNADLIAAAATAFVSLVPSLAEEIVRSMPGEATEPERLAYVQQKGWAELCLAAKRVNLEPLEFAQQVLQVHRQQTGALS